MPHSQLTLYEPQLQRIGELCASLKASTEARAVILVDTHGQFIASEGDVSGFDTTSLASLTAGNMASTQGLAKLIGEQGFPSVYHEGSNESLFLCVVQNLGILVVMFDKTTTLGLVRLRTKKILAQLEEEFARTQKGARAQPDKAPLAELTQEDIDNLFGR